MRDLRRPGPGWPISVVYRGGPRPFLLLKFFSFVFMWSSPPLVGATRNESALVVGWSLKHEVVLRLAGSRDRDVRWNARGDPYWQA